MAEDTSYEAALAVESSANRLRECVAVSGVSNYVGIRAALRSALRSIGDTLSDLEMRSGEDIDYGATWKEALGAVADELDHPYSAAGR